MVYWRVNASSLGWNAYIPQIGLSWKHTRMFMSPQSLRFLFNLDGVTVQWRSSQVLSNDACADAPLLKQVLSASTGITCHWIEHMWAVISTVPLPDLFSRTIGPIQYGCGSNLCTPGGHCMTSFWLNSWDIWGCSSTNCLHSWLLTHSNILDQKYQVGACSYLPPWRRRF